MFYTISVLRITPKSVTIGVNRKKDIYVAIKNIGSAPEKPTKPWRSSTFQCNWIKNYHSPWKRCLHYSKLWISIEWSHFLAINFNWNNLHLGLSHPVPSCPILSLWAHLSGSSAVLHWFSTSVIFTRVDCACQRNCSGTPICGYLINPNMFPRFLQPNLVRLTTPLVNWLIHTLVYPYTIPSYLCVCLLHYLV